VKVDLTLRCLSSEIRCLVVYAQRHKAILPVRRPGIQSAVSDIIGRQRPVLVSSGNRAGVRLYGMLHRLVLSRGGGMEPVQVERFYLSCLAHASYAASSEGVAAIIDPQRDVDIDLEAAASNGWKIEHIVETHLHADFVSGHRELAERTGARIYLGAGSGAQFTTRSRTEKRFSSGGAASGSCRLLGIRWRAFAS
jgi:hypothetical protein